MAVTIAPAYLPIPRLITKSGVGRLQPRRRSGKPAKSPLRESFAQFVRISTGEAAYSFPLAITHSGACSDLYEPQLAFDERHARSLIAPSIVFLRTSVAVQTGGSGSPDRRETGVVRPCAESPSNSRLEGTTIGCCSAESVEASAVVARAAPIDSGASTVNRARAAFRKIIVTAHRSKQRPDAMTIECQSR